MASVVVTERMPVASKMRWLMTCSPTAMLAAVQFMAIRLSPAVASSAAWDSTSATTALSLSSEVRANGILVMARYPAGFVVLGQALVQMARLGCPAIEHLGSELHKCAYCWGYFPTPVSQHQVH